MAVVERKKRQLKYTGSGLRFSVKIIFTVTIMNFDENLLAEIKQIDSIFLFSGPK